MVFHSSFFSTFFYYFFAICMFLYTSNFFVWLRDKKSQRKILYQKVFRKTWSFFCHGNLWAPPPEGATAFLQILKGSWWLIPRLPWYYGRLTAWLGTWPNFTNTLEGLGSILEIEGPWPISRVFLVLLCVQQWGGNWGLEAGICEGQFRIIGPCWVGERLIPSWKLTYPVPKHLGVDDFPFPKEGYFYRSLEGILWNLIFFWQPQWQLFWNNSPMIACNKRDFAPHCRTLSQKGQFCLQTMKDQKKWSLDFTQFESLAVVQDENCPTFCCSAVLGGYFPRCKSPPRCPGGSGHDAGDPQDLIISKKDGKNFQFFGWEYANHDIPTCSLYGIVAMVKIDSEWLICIEVGEVGGLVEESCWESKNVGPAMMRWESTRLQPLPLGIPSGFSFGSPSCTRMYHLLGLSWYDTNGVN